MLTQAKALLQLMRIGNCLIALVAVLLGGQILSHPVFPDAFLLALAMFFAAAGGNVENDILDMEIDSINQPDRALVRGVLSKQVAVVFAAALYVLSVLLGFFVSMLAGGWMLLVFLLLLVYNRWAQRVLFGGNFIVALLCGQAVVFPWVLGRGAGVQPNQWVLLSIAAMFAFVFTMAREIVKDIEDVEGDRECGLKTAPIVLGVGISVRVAAGIIGLGVALLLFVWLDGGKTIFTLGSGFLLLPLGLYVEYLILRKPEKMRKSQKLLKLIMFLGLLLIFLETRISL